MKNKQPSEEMCQQFNAKPEDFRFVTTNRGSVLTDCAHCCFKTTDDTVCEYEDSRCSPSDHDDAKPGYWVLKEKPTKPLTIEEAEAKIAELQKYVETVKAKVPVEGELYKHKHNGDIYIVVQDSANYQRLFLHCLKSKNSPTTKSCQYWCKDSIFGDSRDDFLLIGHVRDML